MVNTLRLYQKSLTKKNNNFITTFLTHMMNFKKELKKMKKELKIKIRNHYHIITDTYTKHYMINKSRQMNNNNFKMHITSEKRKNIFIIFIFFHKRKMTMTQTNTG